MQIAKPVGRHAAVQKYDILSAMMAYGLAQDKTVQRRVMRLMSLITTRYNWQRDELSMGQAEIARLWSVDPRTVKREMAVLRSWGWLVEKRKGARGRVSLHGVDLARIAQDTRTVWDKIGSDFIARMDGPDAPEATNVVPLHPVEAPLDNGGLWDKVRVDLHGSHPARFASWIKDLTMVEESNGAVTLAAPSSFHAKYVQTHLQDWLLTAIRLREPSVARILWLG